MGFVIPTERRHWKTRVLYVLLYLVMSIGALTMVYPFLIMISGSLKCQTDFDQFEVIPSFLTDDALLYRKFERARYKGNIWRYQFNTEIYVENWEDIPFPASINRVAAEDMAEFIRTADLPVPYMTVGQTVETGVQPRIHRQWRQFIYDRFDGDLLRLSDATGMPFKNWDAVDVPETEMFSRGNKRMRTEYEDIYYDEFRPSIPWYEYWPVPTEGLFDVKRYALHQRDIAVFNQLYGTTFESFADIPLERTRPDDAPYVAEWDQYVHEEVNLYFIRLKESAAPAYRAFLATRHKDIARLNQVFGTAYASFDEVPMPARWPEISPEAQDWQAFIEEGDVLPHVELDIFEYRYRDFLRAKYGTLKGLNAAHGAAYESFDTVPLNIAEYDAWLVEQRRGQIVWEFLSRNYRYAIEYLALRGRAFWVTFVFCALNVLGHLIVNPLAAYALSRYHLRYAHWVILFCLLTMAFPAEVGSIPRFLLIREMGLLNTIWALVLPGMAHGFSIFILKGFFDGLPQELYEASVIEGAPERWMFWHVTLSLTKPILAVTAFGAFMSAYGAFMFALIICPDESMWTISVWLYQFQQEVTEPVAFAGLVLASLPVLVAFLIAQKFILRGIVLPVEK